MSRTILKNDLSKTTENSTKGNRQKSTEEEHKDVMEAFYTASLNRIVTSTTIAGHNNNNNYSIRSIAMLQY